MLTKTIIREHGSAPYVGMARKQNGGYNACISVRTSIFRPLVNCTRLQTLRSALWRCPSSTMVLRLSENVAKVPNLKWAKIEFRHLPFLLQSSSFVFLLQPVQRLNASSTHDETHTNRRGILRGYAYRTQFVKQQNQPSNTRSRDRLDAILLLRNNVHVTPQCQGARLVLNQHDGTLELVKHPCRSCCSQCMIVLASCMHAKLLMHCKSGRGSCKVRGWTTTVYPLSNNQQSQQHQMHSCINTTKMIRKKGHIVKQAGKKISNEIQVMQGCPKSTTGHQCTQTRVTQNDNMI